MPATNIARQRSNGTQQHTSSYYAATANNKCDYDALRGEHRCDIVVVGGGFTGVSAMLHLVERVRKYAIDCDLKLG